MRWKKKNYERKNSVYSFWDLCWKYPVALPFSLSGMLYIFLAVYLCQNYSSFVFIIKWGFFCAKTSDILEPNSQLSMDYGLISRIHNLFLFCGGTQGVASRHAYITQMTMFPYHTVASAVTGTATEHSIWSTAKGAISQSLGYCQGILHF